MLYFMMNSVVGPPTICVMLVWTRYNICARDYSLFPSGSLILVQHWGKWFSLSLDALILPHRELELCVRTEESWPLSWTAKSRWAGRSLKMCFACLVTLKAISCHSYSARWQRRIAPWQIVLATGPYIRWTFEVCLSLCERNPLQWSSVHGSSM